MNDDDLFIVTDYRLNANHNVFPFIQPLWRIVTDYRLNANHNSPRDGWIDRPIVTDYRLNSVHELHSIAYSGIECNDNQKYQYQCLSDNQQILLITNQKTKVVNLLWFFDCSPL